MKKICILQNSMIFGGTDTFIINLSKGLVRDGYDVTVVLSTDPSREEKREKELKDSGARIVKTCSLQGGLKAKLRHLRLLFRILKKGGFDCFQTNIDLFNGPQLLVAWLAGVPVRECHSHNSQQGRELREGRTFKVRLYQSIMRWLCRAFANRRGGCSEMAMNFLFGDKWKNDPHSKVIHNGIDFSEYKFPFDVENKKRELGLTNRYNICTVGRIDFQKNPLFIVDVINELFKKRCDCDFVWVGVGEQESEVRERIDKYKIADKMHLLRARSDVPEILRSSDLFFLPSRFEGLGIVLIEAQAAGLPCVVSDVIPSEVDCGLCVPISLDETKEYWAEQINQVLKKQKNLSIDDSKLTQFSIEHMVKEMEELLQ